MAKYSSCVGGVVDNLNENLYKWTISCLWTLLQQKCYWTVLNTGNYTTNVHISKLTTVLPIFAALPETRKWGWIFRNNCRHAVYVPYTCVNVCTLCALNPALTLSYVDSVQKLPSWFNQKLGLVWVLCKMRHRLGSILGIGLGLRLVRVKIRDRVRVRVKVSGCSGRISPCSDF